MKAVKSRDHEEGRAELLGAPGVAPWPYAFMDQLRPFKGLHAHEGRAEKGGGEHQRGGLLPVAAVSEVDRHRHCAAAADEDEGHDRDRSAEHTSELQSLMRNSYAVFCLKTKCNNRSSAPDTN